MVILLIESVAAALAVIAFLYVLEVKMLAADDDGSGGTRIPWFLWGCIGVIEAVVLIPLVYFLATGSAEPARAARGLVVWALAGLTIWALLIGTLLTLKR